MGKSNYQQRFLGVSVVRRDSGTRFKARINHKGRQLNLGRFSDAHTAMLAYDQAAVHLRGAAADASLNFPLGSYPLQDPEVHRRLTEFIVMLAADTTRWQEPASCPEPPTTDESASTDSGCGTAPPAAVCQQQMPPAWLTQHPQHNNHLGTCWGFPPPQPMMAQQLPHQAPHCLLVAGHGYRSSSSGSSSSAGVAADASPAAGSPWAAGSSTSLAPPPAAVDEDDDEFMRLLEMIPEDGNDNDGTAATAGLASIDGRQPAAPFQLGGLAPAAAAPAAAAPADAIAHPVLAVVPPAPAGLLPDVCSSASINRAWADQALPDEQQVLGAAAWVCGGGLSSSSSGPIPVSAPPDVSDSPAVPASGSSAASALLGRVRGALQGLHQFLRAACARGVCVESAALLVLSSLRQHPKDPALLRVLGAAAQELACPADTATSGGGGMVGSAAFALQLLEGAAAATGGLQLRLQAMAAQEPAVLSAPELAVVLQQWLGRLHGASTTAPVPAASLAVAAAAAAGSAVDAAVLRVSGRLVEELLLVCSSS